MKKVMTVLMVLGICAVSAQAGNVYWEGTTDTNWHVSANWDVDGTPGLPHVAGQPVASDLAYIDKPLNECIISGGNAGAAGRVYVGNTSTGELTVTGASSTLTLSGGTTMVILGYSATGNGTLNIEAGGAVTGAGYTYVGEVAGSTGVVTVTGNNSTLTTDTILYVGHNGSGTMNVLAGGDVVNNGSVNVGMYDDGGRLTVDGAGSTFACTNAASPVYVGYFADSVGTMEIFNGGLVSVRGTLSTLVDTNGVNMKTGGMLALYGDADDDIDQFLDLVSGTDTIRYWDGSAWDDITNGTIDVDYTLSYKASGDLTGYTVLTVPEPATLGLLAVGGLMALIRKRR